MDFNIAEMDKRVTWQQPTRVSDSMGGFTETWVDACTVWAAIWPKSAKEIRQGDKTTLESTATIRMRYRALFRTSWRGKYKNRYFAIVSVVNPGERNEWLDVIVKEAA